ncbi:MAG TPA: diguanylate cyclase [Candidatus Edwardsbacteria bacterium]|nr:diguanylate cyclase [Candidatus Edwardsbacteria bacterium]
MATILVADEDRLFALTIVHILSKYGHQVLASSKGAQLLAILKSETLDLIMVDVVLATKGNLQLLKKIRELKPDVPLVLFVARTISREVREQLRQGIYDYINKPFGHDELLVTVERGLERRRLNLENKLLLSDIQQRVRELSAFNTIAKTLNSTLRFREVMDVVMDKIKELIKAEAWSILMLDEKTNELVFEVAAGEQGDSVRKLRIPVGQGVAGWVAQAKQPVIVSDTANDQRFFRGVDEKTGFRTKSILAAPLVSRGRLIGVVEIINKVGDIPFDEKDLTLLQTFTDHAAIAIENARLYERARKLSVTDDLTGLYNSRYCDQFLKQALEQGAAERKPVSLLFLDLDHMKQVDDSYGHLLGGETLKEVADRIAALVRPPLMASRYGGDEYVIVLPGRDAKEALLLAEKIRAAIESKPFLTAHDLSCRLSASIGIASFPRHGATADELLSQADKAMYRVKETGKNNILLAD